MSAEIESPLAVGVALTTDDAINKCFRDSSVAKKIGEAESVARSFFEQLWADDFECAYVCGKPQGGVWTDTAVHNRNEALAEVARRVEQGGDVYMSCATFGSANGRKAANAKEMRDFYLDLDTGADKTAKGKGYATKKEAASKLIDFCRALGIAAPSIVDSGNGLHAHWSLDKPVPAARWKAKADDLKSLTHKYGLLADDAVTADAARVLRVPGTFNYKDPANPKPVTIKHISPPVSAEAFIAAIEKAHSVIIPVTPAEVPAFMTGERGNLDDVLTPETPEAIQRMQSALDSIPPDCDRVTWRQTVWGVLAHGWSCCVDIAREWSQGSTEKHNEAEFDVLVASFDPQRGTGPGSLYYIARSLGWKDVELTIEATASPNDDHSWHVTDLDNYRPVYAPEGIPARKFVGPNVGGCVHLFPANALSALVSLSALGKTSVLISIGAHVAAGKNWNGQPVAQSKVVMFFCEETAEELSRKFSAIIDGWSPSEQQAAMNNMLLVPLLGQDQRLTIIERGQYRGSGVAEKMIAMSAAFGLQGGLVVIDHMQGFTSGDMNVSETATSICREANKIVEATGAAVVFAAHISKANIKATELEQGFAVGSLAFENATRQMVGMLPMSEEAAKKYGVEDLLRSQYVWLGLPKNSYGASTGGVWLQKVFVPKYHTVVIQPVQLVVPVSVPRQSANEKLAERIIVYLVQHPRSSRNQLDGVAGEDGVLKASKSRVRDVLASLIDAGDIEVHLVTDAERQEYGIAKQVKAVLNTKATGKPAE